MSDFNRLLPPNATLFERRMERVSSRVENINILLSTLWNADTCPAPHLGWLAWALSVDVWDDRWSEEVKREVIRQSGAIHRAKGTIGAVRRALRSIGVDIEISEWFEHNAPPHTFRLDVYAEDIFAGGLGINKRFLDIVRLAIDNVKPARSHYAVRISDSHQTRHYSRSGVRSQIRHKEAIEPIARIEQRTSIANYRSTLRHRVTSKINHDVLRRDILEQGIA